MPKTEIELSIIVTCVFDMLETTKKHVEAYWANTPPIYELIVVAQAPGEEMLKWLKELERDRKAEVLVFPKPLGTATAHNIGFRKAKGEYIFAMSNSMRATRGWLKPLLDTLREHPDYGYVCCLEIRNDGPGFHESALFSRETLFKVGLYDEEYSQGIGFESWCLRRKFWKAGYKPHAQFQSVAILEGEGGSTYRRLYNPEQMQEKYIRNQTIFLQKWGGMGNWDLPLIEGLPWPFVPPVGSVRESDADDIAR